MKQHSGTTVTGQGWTGTTTRPDTARIDAARQRATPCDLPVVRRPAIALIDVDNIVIRAGAIDREHALADLTEIYEQLGCVELSLAVVSPTAVRSLGGDLWLRFPAWTWRLADAGKDAADHQLLDFARAVRRQRPGAVVAIASGDGIFAQLAQEAPIEVVVPLGLPGVSKRLRPYRRELRRQERSSPRLAA